MERIESKLVEVAPSLDQRMTDVMAKFGWSLQGRQEIQIHKSPTKIRGAVAGKNVAKRDFMGNLYFEGAYELMAEAIAHFDHYVTLHFSRSLVFRQNKELNALEQEYFSLKYEFLKDSGKALKGGVGAVILAIVTLQIMVVAILFAALAAYCFWSVAKTKQANLKIKEHNAEVERRGTKILKQVEELVGQIEKA